MFKLSFYGFFGSFWYFFHWIKCHWCDGTSNIYVTMSCLVKLNKVWDGSINTCRSLSCPCRPYVLLLRNHLTNRATFIGHLAQDCSRCMSVMKCLVYSPLVIKILADLLFRSTWLVRLTKSKLTFNVVHVLCYLSRFQLSGQNKMSSHEP